MYRFENSAVWATIIVASLAGIARADTAWSWRNPLPTGAALSAVAVLDTNTATLVGNGGTILRTTDGGATWTAQASGTTAYLNAVCFTDINTGTAVGTNGTILRTADGGATWARQFSREAGRINGIVFTDADTATAVGDGSIILRTTTAGETTAPR